MTDPQTFVYSTVDGIDIHLDLYLPPTPVAPSAPLPVIIFFHGGGLFRGSRRSILPELKDAALANNWAFISSDYRLLLPSTGFDILTDITALFTFLRTLLTIDTARLLVAGHSGGAYIARQAALHGVPKPKAFFSVSGQGGRFLAPDYFTPKPYLQKKLLGSYQKYSSRTSAEFLALQACSDLPWEWAEKKRSKAAGQTAEVGSRPWLSGMASVTGTRLDFLVGRQGFSQMLREKYEMDGAVDLESLVPEEMRVLFPELGVGGFPPSYVLHGTGDRNVDITESEKTARGLESARVRCVFVAAENWGHGWSKVVWERWGKDVMPFFEQCIARE